MKLFANHAAHLALAVAASVLSTGCFSIQTVIKLQPDGSGTIEQTNLVNTAMIGMAAGMATSVAGADKAGQAPKVDDLFSEEQLRAQAAQLGTGVRFVSSEKITENGMQGARALYAFDRVDGIKVGGGTRLRNGAAEGPSGPQMQFALTPHGPGAQRLTVTLPESGATATPDGAPGKPAQAMPQLPPEAFAMVKSMFAGARMSVEVEVDGRIVGTNAPASHGARATLVAIDFGEMLSDPSKLQALQALKPGTDFAAVRKALDGMPGVLFPTEQKVTIDFAK